MKLIALHLTNVRKFAGKSASITGIGDGVTVVSEANEFGKSTFFDALHALFFEKFSSSAKAVKSLQPYAGGAVHVAADVQIDAGIFRVEKRFLSKKTAKVTRLVDGKIVAQEDEAERWISTLLGVGGEGPAGLLWVRQGLVGLEPDSTKEKTQLTETRRDLLSSVAGEIDTMTGGRRMDSVMRRVAETLGGIATKTGRKTGAWKDAADTADALETKLSGVTLQVHELETALKARKQADIALKRLDNPDAMAKRDNAKKAAETALQTAKAHASTVALAQQEYDLAGLKAANAQSDLDRLLNALTALQSADRSAKARASDADHAAAQALQQQHALDEAQKRHAEATAAITQARLRLDALRTQIRARAAKAQAKQLATQISKAHTAMADRDAARAVVKASGATPDWLRSVETAHTSVAQLEAALLAQATRLFVHYDGDARITQNGSILPAGQPVHLDGDTQLDLPGIGQMVIHSQAANADSKDRLSKAQAALDRLLSGANISTLDDARTLMRARTQADAKAELEQTRLDTLAPDGLDSLRAALADANLAASQAHEQPVPTTSELEAHLAQTERDEETARLALRQANADNAQVRETAAKLQAAATRADEILQSATADIGAPDTLDARRTQLLRDQATAQAALETSQSTLEKLVHSAPDLDTAQAELTRATGAVNTARNERTQVGEQLAALSSQIRTLAGHGIEEHRDLLVGQLETARSTEARFARQAAALTRLQTALNDERNAARDTYFGPVQEELKPLLSILHRDAALSFDSDSLLPSGLVRADAQESMDDLSGGTQEQIAILTRLAFARLFARQGRHMPIVLDDALVYSDDDRIIKMFTALTRVAQDQQILVFSCRQLAFQDLGGAKPTVEIVDI
ncbi:chromosome segregation protein SMC [Pseudosulfitobacter sp. SM2401]|uniref:AAA family ATPase n=1 Tax=Pseudosulfitobacter sp. SM2401 TaxID=3350098 RepID=UPI0036F3D3F9